MHLAKSIQRTPGLKEKLERVRSAVNRSRSNAD
jgi:hypothetical protein